MRKHALKFASLIAFTLAVIIFVFPQRAAADQDDPPTRIARLSHVDGSVSFEPAGTDEWVTPVVNRPMTTGDKLWADHDSRAELHLGAASIRLGSNTGFSFLNLDDNTVQLQLTEGTLRIRVRHLDRYENFEVDTPNLAFSVQRAGIYRINVNEAGDTTVVVVRDGEGEVTGGGQSFRVHSDETGIFSGTDQLNADIEGVGDDDDLERWSYERDRREDHSASRRYVSEDAVGYEDLDEYGGWRETPEYGTIWFPHTTVVGWAPYRYGHWVWIAPWGYTWVDDEPWGFAPFHYGRWVAVGGVWGWVPCRPAVVGVAYVRPVYAPALVAWVGGPHVAVGVAIGGGAAVGWFPLGPREVYVPSYPVSRTYVNNVNITNTTVNTTVVNNYYNNVVVNKNVNVTNVKYVNQTVPGAVTATSTQTFTSGQAVHNNMMKVNEREMASAQVVAATPPVPPTRQSLVGVARPASARPPDPVVTRAVVAKTTPPPPPPKFEKEQAAIQQNGGRPLAVSQVRQIQRQQEQPKSEVRIAPPARMVATPQNANDRSAPPQNQNRPVQQPSNVQQNNRPSIQSGNAERPNNGQPNRPPNAERQNTPPPNAQPNRPSNNDRPPNAQNQPLINERPNQPPSNTERPNNAQPNQANRPPNAERSNTPPPNVQPNRPPSNDRPPNNDRPPSARPANPNDRPATQPPNAERPANVQPNQPNRPPTAERPATPPPNVQPNRPPNNDRPPAARPSNPPPNGNPQLEQQHQQELQNMHRQQDQERQRVEQQQQQERQRLDQQRGDEQRRQQAQQQQQRQLEDLQRKHQQEQQQVQQRQQQEHQQQRPQERPPQVERQQQPPPRQQQQQPPPKQQDKPKEKEKPPKG
jgi:hypothetical protein